MRLLTPSPAHSLLRAVARSGVTAAIYMALTLLFRPISFGSIQFRIAEALMLLPILTVDAVPGLFIGCLLGNLLGGAVWVDVLLGAVATLLAAAFAYEWRDRPALAVLSTVLFNSLIVGPVVYLAYVRAPGTPMHIPTMLANMGTVGFGELVVCSSLGLPLLAALRRLPQSVFD